ncbi:orotate phosphoribosyltransferase [Persicirhabdus sediminis]|nr:orotate phosphoribosyltransferase [Persicirhabdus sediminis]
MITLSRSAFDISPAAHDYARMSNEATRQQLKAMLLEKSVRTGEFTLASGKTSDLYIDCRITALDPVGANLIGQLGWDTVKEKVAELGIDAIGGMTMGADPISLAVGMTSAVQNPEAPIQVFTVRKEPKGHGRGKQIEGNFKEGDTIIVVDDVITTGGSTLKAVDAIEAAGGKVAFALILVDREEGGREAIEARDIPVVSLFSRSTLLDE